MDRGTIDKLWSLNSGEQSHTAEPVPEQITIPRDEECDRVAGYVLDGFRDLVLLTAPDDVFEQLPRPASSGAEAPLPTDSPLSGFAATEVVLQQGEHAKLGSGSLVARVRAVRGTGRVPSATAAYADLGAVPEFSVVVCFRASALDVQGAPMDTPLLGETYAFDDIASLGSKDLDQVLTARTHASAVQADAEATLGVLWEAVKDPELNPELAARFVERTTMPLPAWGRSSI
jgi:hypothetical protein